VEGLVGVRLTGRAVRSETFGGPRASLSRSVGRRGMAIPEDGTSTPRIKVDGALIDHAQFLEALERGRLRCRFDRRVSRPFAEFRDFMLRYTFARYPHATRLKSMGNTLTVLGLLCIAAGLAAAVNFRSWRILPLALVGWFAFVRLGSRYRRQAIDVLVLSDPDAWHWLYISGQMMVEKTDARIAAD
jgi:hypothetical protein